jgi:excisionase family DNA binding protein
MSVHDGTMMPITGHDGPVPGAMPMRLLTVQEVAETMRVSEKTVRRIIKCGDLSAYKLGDRGQLRIKERDLERYVESRRVEIDNAESHESEEVESDE